MTATPATKPRTRTAKPKAEAAAKNADKALTNVVDDKGKRLTLQQLKNKLRNEAEREVLDAHRPEVIERTAAKYKEHNIEYVRRLSEPEKAAKEIAEHLNRYPQLRTMFGAAGTTEVFFADVEGNPEAEDAESVPPWEQVEAREGE